MILRLRFWSLWAWGRTLQVIMVLELFAASACEAILLPDFADTLRAKAYAILTGPITQLDARLLPLAAILDGNDTGAA